jgi:RES domain-containing protein
MRYPPSHAVKVGRLNDHGSRCFYAATTENTALAEIGLHEGDFVQIAGFRVKPGAGIRVAVVGELFHVHKTGYLRIVGTDPGGSMARYLNGLGIDQGKLVLYIDAFLSTQLEEVNAAERAYTLSRAIAAMIYRNAAIDGILFPSARDKHGMNLALRPNSFDEMVDQVRCVHVRITKLRLFGFVDFEVLQEATDVSPDGNLVWGAPGDPSRARFFNLTPEEYELAP